MVTSATILLTISALHLVASHPLRENVPNLHEINNLSNLRRSHKPLFDPNITIQQVEELIKDDPNLPRLTRGEILDIITNITASDDEKKQPEKSVMLVMPYSAANMENGKIQELFTKPPITKLIGTEPFVVKPSNVRKKVPHKHSSYNSDTFINPVTEIQAASIQTTLPPSTEPSRSTTHLQKRKRRPTPTKSLPRFTNHKYIDETKNHHNEGLRIIDPPKFEAPTQTQPHPIYLTLPTTYNSPLELPTTSVEPPRQHEPLQSSPFALLQPHNVQPFVALKPANLPDLPNDLKTALNNLNLQNYYEEAEMHQQPSQMYNNPEDFPLINEEIQSTTTTTPMPDISHVADTLTPEMKELLMNFGLLPNPQQKPTGFKDPDVDIGSPSADITRESYVQFKPLPESTATHGEMEEFLGRFGLGRDTTPKRTQKALQTIPDLPEHMKQVLIEMDLVNRQTKKIQENNVFKPMVESYTTEQELEKLNQLLDIIKQLEKLNSTNEEELNKTVNFEHLKDLVGSLNQGQLPPYDQQELVLNPLNYDFGLNKNEIKRQENSSVTTISTETTATTTEEGMTANIKGLEESFGGSEGAELTVTIPPATEAPKTGFYYLLDWNTFFDIDDQKGKRVNLRFQPKAGDPKRFLSINVP